MKPERFTGDVTFHIPRKGYGLASDQTSAPVVFLVSACSHQQSVKRSRADSLEDGRVKNSGHVWKVCEFEFCLWKWICFNAVVSFQFFSLSVFEEVRTQFFHIPNFRSSQWRNVKLYVQKQQCAWSRSLWDDQRRSCRTPLDHERGTGQKVTASSKMATVYQKFSKVMMLQPERGHDEGDLEVN